MSLPAIEIYSSVECGSAYLHVYRLRRVYPEYKDRVRLVWRALPLEYINNSAIRKPPWNTIPAPWIEPDIPMRPWQRPEHEYPTTAWPAFEALACAQAQGHDHAYSMSWALRHGFYWESRNLALRNELLQVAREVAEQTGLDTARFEDDFDSGRYKHTIIDDARRGWHDLKAPGSPTFVLPDGRQFTRLGIGTVQFDPQTWVVSGYTPPEGDPLDAFREMFEAALAPGVAPKAADEPLSARA